MCPRDGRPNGSKTEHLKTQKFTGQSYDLSAELNISFLWRSDRVCKAKSAWKCSIWWKHPHHPLHRHQDTHAHPHTHPTNYPRTLFAQRFVCVAFWFWLSGHRPLESNWSEAGKQVTVHRTHPTRGRDTLCRCATSKPTNKPLRHCISNLHGSRNQVLVWVLILWYQKKKKNLTKYVFSALH